MTEVILQSDLDSLSNYLNFGDDGCIRALYMDVYGRALQAKRPLQALWDEDEANPGRVKHYTFTQGAYRSLP